MKEIIQKMRDQMSGIEHYTTSTNWQVSLTVIEWKEVMERLNDREEFWPIVFKALVKSGAIK
jgi:hypothetical protein